MSECTTGELNKQAIQQLTQQLSERNTENMLMRKDVSQLQVDNEVLKTDISHIKDGVSEIKQMIINDQVERNSKREQVETNKKDIQRHDKQNIYILLLVIGAFIKQTFF